jgi:hypothetical protein
MPVPTGQWLMPVPTGQQLMLVPTGRWLTPVPTGRRLTPVPTGRRLMLVPTMPSFPPFDGVAVPFCAGTHADSMTIRAMDARDIDGKSLPITTSTGEHDIFSSHLRDHGGGIWSDGCTTNAVGPSNSTRPLGKGFDGTLACYHRSGNAIAELGPSFLANSVFSHPPSTNDGGERRIGGTPCFGTQSTAFGTRHV